MHENKKITLEGTKTQNTFLRKPVEPLQFKGDSDDECDTPIETSPQKVDNNVQTCFHDDGSQDLRLPKQKTTNCLFQFPNLSTSRN